MFSQLILNNIFLLILIVLVLVSTITTIFLVNRDSKKQNPDKVVSISPTGSPTGSPVVLPAKAIVKWKGAANITYINSPNQNFPLTEIEINTNNTNIGSDSTGVLIKSSGIYSIKEEGSKFNVRNEERTETYLDYGYFNVTISRKDDKIKYERKLSQSFLNDKIFLEEGDLLTFNIGVKDIPTLNNILLTVSQFQLTIEKL